MRSAEWKRFAGPLLGPEWDFSKRLAYRKPVGWVVRGLLEEPSDWGGFYLWDVRMPLYVPSNVLVLSWSDRVGGGTCRWEVGPDAADAITRTAKSIAAAMDADDTVLLAPQGGVDNFRMQEARAYGLVLEGAVKSAIEVLGRVCRVDPRYQWQHEVLARASEIRTALIDGKVSEVLQRIGEWRTSTAAAIGVKL